MRYVGAVAGAVMLFVLLVGVGWLIRWQPWTWEGVCDGEVPAWMLDAQGGLSGSCPYVMPSDLAPAGADWSKQCTFC